MNESLHSMSYRVRGKLLFIVVASALLLLLQQLSFRRTLEAERSAAFDQGFRSGQWNGFYYSGNLEAAAASQVRLEDLGEWEP